ncbi:glucoamylase family protein [Amaricoccus solimangrovi]|uniref:Beta-glucosidase n=1 Tax=Amaricoccus solimangrovi TaxID=2589815 RepID=A0A501WVN5_9RHOB|nr:glucoamylase family protein [Amaricoccus solimangrovi]TPE51447.1 beta-glucosidase [Amaricoccus solimangrovi]
MSDTGAGTLCPAEAGDAALLDLTQRATLRYFWDFAHPVSGLARERSNVTPRYGLEAVTTGGSGFGVMAIIVGVSRGWIDRREAVARLWTMAKFLEKADSYHGVWPHFLNGETGRTIPFSRKDDGADLVETSYLIMGLLCARQFFDGAEEGETRLRALIDWLWREVEWDWHTRGGRNVLYWHWSPNNGWSMNHEIRGWNECLVTYLLAASAPRYPVSAEVYHRGWADGRAFLNGRSYDGVTLPLGPDRGGPLFLAHYSFLGLDPRGLRDRYADYWEQNTAHTRINRAHCIANPGGFLGYGPDCWGLTACDGPRGYDGFSPANDRGVIAPAAALGSFPYAPEAAMRALRHFHGALGPRIWTDLGFVDAFSETEDWYAASHLAIDQGPIVVMIENARTGLLWNLFMSCPEIRDGLRRLDFESPRLTG